MTRPPVPDPCPTPPPPSLPSSEGVPDRPPRRRIMVHLASQLRTEHDFKTLLDSFRRSRLAHLLLHDKAINRGISALLVGFCLVLLGSWVPHYLSWPWWIDLDHFATLAQAWDAGRRPYRDMFCNQFPGTIYLFWALGKVCGWGHTAPIYAVDACLIIALGLMLLIWSQRRFGEIFPGLAGYTAFLFYYLNLDYRYVAQRDWHGPFFATTAILVVQAFQGGRGRLASAPFMAAAITMRPQTALFLPSLLMALVLSARTDRPFGAGIAKGLMWWGLAFAASLTLGFAPLARVGLLGDFVGSIRGVAFSHRYNENLQDFGAFRRTLLDQLADPKLRALAAGLVMLVIARRATRGLGLTWLVALATVQLYRPLSPMKHVYLAHPLALVESISLAVVAGMAVEARLLRPAVRLVVIALTLFAVRLPIYCSVADSTSAVSGAIWGAEVGPPNCIRTVYQAYNYEEADYSAAVGYLRSRTQPQTEVANLLFRLPALTGMTGRLPPFRVESLALVSIYDPALLVRMAEDLDRAGESVVVWAPAEWNKPLRFAPDQTPINTSKIHEVVLLRYRPEARFGTIEIWRRVDPRDASPILPVPASPSRLPRPGP